MHNLSPLQLFLDGLDESKINNLATAFGIEKEEIADLFSLKIKLEGQNLDRTIPADLAHALWKLQVAYYRMAAQILHGSPSAKLSPEEKQKYLLVFKIEEGSTEAIASLFGGLEEIASYVLNNMEPWQVLALAILFAGVYLGKISIAEISKNKERITELEKERIRAESENKERNAELEKERIRAESENKRQEEERGKIEEINRGYENIFRLAFNERKEDFSALKNEVLIPISEAGKEGRLAIIKNVSGLEKANISGMEYDSRKISEIRRRSPRTKVCSEITQENIIIEKIDVSDRNRIRVTVRVKDTERVFTSDVSLDMEDEDAYDKSMDIIWSSVRYPNNFLWAEISSLTSGSKLISSTILAVAKEKKDLSQDEENPSE